MLLGMHNVEIARFHSTKFSNFFTNQSWYVEIDFTKCFVSSESNFSYNVAMWHKLQFSNDVGKILIFKLPNK